MDNLKIKALEYFAAKPLDDSKAQKYLGEAYKEVQTALACVETYHDINSALEVLEKFISHVAEDAINDLEGCWDKLHSGMELAIHDEYFSKYQTKEKLYSSIASLLGRVRYLEQDKVTSVLLRFWKEDESSRGVIDKVFKELASFNLHAVNNIGFSPQLKLLNFIQNLYASDRAECFPLVVSICNEFLSTNIEGHDWNYRTVTIKSAAIPGSEDIKKLRTETVSLLIGMYDLSASVRDKKVLLNAMNNACRLWSRGEITDDARYIVENNTVDVLQFWSSLVPHDQLELVQKIEHDAYWNYYHGNGDTVKNAALCIEAAIKKNSEYQIYRDLVGFEGIFGDWAEERNQAVEVAQDLRDHRVRAHIESVGEDNIQEWLSRIELYLETDSRDLATFPELFKFTQGISIRFPKTVLEKFTESSALYKSAVPIFKGLWDSSEQEYLLDSISRWIENGEYLFDIAALFLSVGDVDDALIDSFVKKAIAVNDSQTLSFFIRIFDQHQSSLSRDRLNELFETIFSYFKKSEDDLWVNGIWFSMKGESFISSLSEDNLMLLVDNLIYVRDIDHRVEAVLEQVSQNSVDNVFRCLDLRIQYPKEGRAKLAGKYEDIPFSLYSINKILAEHPDKLFTLISKNYESEYGVFQYGVASLFKKCFAKFEPQHVDLILEKVDLSIDEDFNLVLAVVQSYEGASSILPLVKSILTNTICEGDRVVAINTALLSTGVVHGEYGFAEAYKAKLDSISPWLSDQNDNVVKFAYQYKDLLEKLTDEEVCRVDERVAIEKHTHGLDEE